MEKKKKKSTSKKVIIPPQNNSSLKTSTIVFRALPKKPMLFPPNHPTALPPSRTQKEIIKKKKNAIRKIWSPPPHVRATSLCVPPPRTAISKPFLMESPSKDDKLHLHQHYFCICSPIAYPTQCNNRNLEATKMATNMKWKMKSIRLHHACILKADF